MCVGWNFINFSLQIWNDNYFEWNTPDAYWMARQ